MKWKFNKRSLLMFLLIAVILTSAVFAAPGFRTLKVSDVDITLELNGEKMDFADGEKPFIHEGVTYVPVRSFSEQDNKEVSWDAENKKVVVKGPNKVSEDPRLEQNVSGTLWLMSGENRANSYQAFNWAKKLFDEALEEKGEEKLAVIVDIDDTIIDSTSYTNQLMGGKEWTTQAWEEWVASDSPKPLPGSVEFLNYVVEKGGEVFYVTNRWPAIRPATLESLEKLGFPIEDEKHLFVREDGAPSSKEDRISQAGKDRKVVLIMGDNLEDFSDAFLPSLGVEGRNKAVDRFKEEWGTKMIVLPNPMYGDWEKTIVNGEKGLSIDETIERRKELLLRYR